MSCFFRVLIGEWTTKLRIPRLFVSSFSLTPKRVIIINSSSEGLWMVDMEEEEDKKELYFKRGWAKFVKDNALETGDFIVFQFNGKSRFNVTLCGKSACEKKLEISRAKASHIEQNHHKRKGKDPIDDVERQTVKLKLDHAKIKEETMDFHDYGTSSQETFSWDETWESQSEDEDEEEEESDEFNDIKSKPHDSILNNGEGSHLGSVIPSFSVHLQPAYAKGGCMCIPTDFFKEHIRKEKQEVEIETMKGVWKVTLLPHKKRERTFARFSKGWSEFARLNRFKIGQTLYFKMVRRGKCPKFIVSRQKSIE